jgi:hypothetical protein
LRFVYLARKLGQFPFETGADLYCEVQPGQWVHADKVPSEILRKAMENGSFKAFEVKPGKPIPVLNLADVQQRLIAARLGLTYAGKKANSLREIDEALKQIQQTIDQIELDELTALLNRLEVAEHQIKQLEEERQIEEIVEESKPASMEEVTADLARAFRKKEKSLDVEMLAHIAEASGIIARNNEWFANPKLFAKLKRQLKNALQG